MAPAVRGVLFDKDGTLFDFDATWRGVVTEVIAALAPEPALARRLADAGGLDLATGRFRAGSPIVSGAVAETAELWAPLLPGLGADEIEARIRRLSAEAVGPATLVPAVADLPALLAELAAAGLALGVATHDSEEAARAQLAAVGALSPFAFLAGYDSGHGLKPGPGMLRAFADRTGLAPEEIAVVGDSLHDLRMARSAGARALAVLTGPAGAEELAPEAEAVLPSIGALPAHLGLARAGQ